MKNICMVLVMCTSSSALAETYVEGQYGTFWNLLDHSNGVTAAVDILSMDIGKDLSLSGQRPISVSVSYSTGSFNGMAYDGQPGNIPVDAYFQGDSRIHAIVGKGQVELFSLGGGDVAIGASAGVMAMPTQMDKASFDTLVVSQSWGLTEKPNGTAFPIAGTQFKWLKPTVDNSMEWGLVTDVSYVIGWDVMLSEQLVLRYTF